MNKSTDKVLLIGNGINLLDENQAKSWKELLIKLKSLSADCIDMENEFKPFPLSYEEILSHKDNNYDGGMKVLKEEIASSLSDISPNSMHKAIMKANIPFVITTNYDYAFEKAVRKDFKKNNKKEGRSTSEKKHSLRRLYWMEEETKAVMHIHGEIDDEKYRASEVHYPCKSILIGYEQYVAYTSIIREFLLGQLERKNPKTQQTERFPSITSRLKARASNPEDFIHDSWVDLFFTHEVNIAGLNLDFSEIDLWFLLNYRFKLQKSDATRELITNDINYFYKTEKENTNVTLDKIVQHTIKKRRQKAITDVLEALGVNCIPIEVSSYKKFYQNILDRISN